jgi:hypothetical protein
MSAADDWNEYSKWSINHSWKQPYSMNPVYNVLLETELDRLDAIDLLVDNMLTYPDAEAIINKIRQGEGND